MLNKTHLTYFGKIIATNVLEFQIEFEADSMFSLFILRKQIYSRVGNRLSKNNTVFHLSLLNSTLKASDIYKSGFKLAVCILAVDVHFNAVLCAHLQLICLSKYVSNVV